eukprot:3962859-Alexandrium_andersonii.AAC.1
MLGYAPHRYAGPRAEKDRRASEPRSRFEQLPPDSGHELREALVPFVGELPEEAAYFDKGRAPRSGRKLVFETKRDGLIPVAAFARGVARLAPDVLLGH